MAKSLHFINNKKLCQYRLLKDYYKPNSFSKSGQLFERFFDEFCQNVFDENLRIFSDIGELPLVYGEKTGYSSIAYSLHKMGYYAWSECRLDFIEKQKGAKTKKNKWNFVDFWCMRDKNAFEAWIEVKCIGFNANGKGDFAKQNETIFKDLREKILKLKDAVKEEKLATTAFKVSLFVVPVYYYCSVAHKVDLDALESDLQIQEILEQEMQKYKYDDNGSKGLLLGILDLRESIGANHKSWKDWGYRVPFIALGAIVLE